MRHTVSPAYTLIKTGLLLLLFIGCLGLVRANHSVSLYLARLPLWASLSRWLGLATPHRQEQLIATGILCLCFLIALLLLQGGELIVLLLLAGVRKQIPKKQLSEKQAPEKQVSNKNTLQKTFKK